MKSIFNKSILSVFALLAFACSSEDDLVADWIEVNTPESPSTGSLDLSNYVAVGNSLTAGFADAALYPEGQDNSYPNILASQFMMAGGGSFVQPDISSGNGFGGIDGSGNPIGKSFIDLETALAALAGVEGVEVGDAIQFTEGSFLSTSSKKGAKLNNFGVPGARVVDLTVNGYGDPTFGNPFYAAFATSGTASVLEDAVSADASFFTLWIGSNDVLGYATNGGDENEATITATDAFQTAYGTVLSSLTANGAEGVVLNLPPVTIIPFFQTVASLSDGAVNVLPEGSIDAATAGFLNSLSAYGAYNAGLDQMVGLSLITQAEADMRKITFAADVANPPVITDESLTDLTAYGLASMRQAQVDAATGSYDLFPLTALSVIGAESVPGDPTSVYGVGVPVPDKYTLTMSEQVAVITGYATFNGVIEALVSANPNVTLLDVRPLFADIYGLTAAQATALQLGADAVAAADGVLGMEVGGINLVPLSLSQEELYNSIWSTDGVHPNARGAAIVANEIIRLINDTYGASIPEVNPLDFAPINAPF